MSCCNCLLIDEKCFKQYANMNDTVSFEKLRPFILEALELDILRIVGETCYIDLCDKFQNDTLNAIETEFVNKIMPVFSNYALFYYTQDGDLQNTNIGKVYVTSNSAMKMQDRQKLNQLEIIRQRIKRYQDKLEEFMFDNQDAFDCIEPTNCKTETNKNKIYTTITAKKDDCFKHWYNK